MDQSDGLGELGGGLWVCGRIRSGRSADSLPDGAAQAISIAQVQWGEPAYASFVCGDWNFLFPISFEFDSSAAVLPDGGGRGDVAFYSADVSSFAVGGR